MSYKKYRKQKTIFIIKDVLLSFSILAVTVLITLQYARYIGLTQLYIPYTDFLLSDKLVNLAHLILLSGNRVLAYCYIGASAVVFLCFVAALFFAVLFIKKTYIFYYNIIIVLYVIDTLLHLFSKDYITAGIHLFLICLMYFASLSAKKRNLLDSIVWGKETEE